MIDLITILSVKMITINSFNIFPINNKICRLQTIVYLFLNKKQFKIRVFYIAAVADKNNNNHI